MGLKYGKEAKEMMDREKIIKAARLRYKATGCIKPGCYGCAAEFAIEQSKPIIDDFLARVRALEPLLYQAEFEKAETVEWDYFEEAIQQVYAEMFPEEVK